jgi:hypothetical protein
MNLLCVEVQAHGTGPTSFETQLTFPEEPPNFVRSGSSSLLSRVSRTHTRTRLLKYPIAWGAGNYHLLFSISLPRGMFAQNTLVLFP